MKLLKGFVLLLMPANALIAQTNITIKEQAGAPQISKHIYGHFAEHLGACIYDGMYVGEKSGIPNTNGVRNDVVEALKNLKIPNLRWPGGCFADTYHWRDGVGPKENRPAIVNRWWGGVTEDNSFGTHDFLNMCELIGTEPYLAGNVATGTVQEMSDWVDYVGLKEKGPMADLRKANGRAEPWKVPFWGVGNEAWGCGGNMRPEYYADEFRKFATFMAGWDNTTGIKRIASGANGADYHWTEVLMKQIPHNMLWGVALHHYSVINWNKKGPAASFTEAQYFRTMEQALFMDSLVFKHSAIMDKYDPQKKVALVVDEWGGWYEVEPGTNPGFLYQQNTIRDAMIAGVTLNIFNNHAARVKMANLAQIVNVLQSVILTKGDKMILTPTYHVMEMYKVHQDAQLLPLEIKTDAYELDGKKLNAVNASASKDKAGTTNISLVNIHPSKSQTVNLTLPANAGKGISGRVLQSKKIQDYNSFDAPETIKPAAFSAYTRNAQQLSVVLPPASVVVLALK